MLSTPRLASSLVLLAALPQVLAVAQTDVQRLRHVYKETAHRPLELVCYLPPQWRADEARPAILFYFGGGFWTRNVDQFARQAEYFARRGLVTVLVDYRTGEADGTKPPAAFEDARSAMRWVRQHASRLGLDPQRIAASGGSAGGSLAASLIIADGLDAPGEDTAVSVKPNALLLYNPGLSTRLNDRTRDRFGDEATWRKTAAALHADAATPPTLLLYGSQDNLLSGGRELAARLRELKVPAELELTEGVGHGFFNFSPHLAESTRRVDEFLQTLGWLDSEPSVPLPAGSAPLSESANNPERGRP